MNRVEQFRHQRPRPALYALTLLALLLAQGQSRDALAQGQWATNGNNINNTNTGNVGIGTTAPESPLHVNGPLLSTGTSAGYGFGNRESGNGIDTWFWYSAGNVARLWRTRDLMAVTPAGNVGIGTASPDVFLGDTAGGAGTPGAIGTIVNIQSNPGYSMLRLTNSAAGGYEMGRVTFGSPAYTGAEKRTAVILSRSTSASTTAPSGNLIFYTSDAGPLAERLRISPAGNVGVGTSAPGHKLDVAGNINASGLCIGGNCKTDWAQVGGASQWATGGTSVFYNAGSVGIGTGAPAFLLDVVGSTNTPFRVRDSSGREYFSTTTRTAAVAAWTTPVVSLAGGRLIVESSGPEGGNESVIRRAVNSLIFNPSDHSLLPGAFVVRQAGGAAGLIVDQNENGNVGIGTHAPASKLHVAGNITVDGNINAKYQDVAEWVPSTQSLAAGTVVVLDTARSNHVLASSAAYDTRVAGVVSARPGVLLGERGEGKLMVATTGRVKVRVDATRGPVRVGDLLVTSDVEGLAMKSESILVGGRPMHLPGTLIGKALEPLEKGVGEILVLLSLQ